MHALHDMTIVPSPMPPQHAFDNTEKGETKRNVWARFRRFSNWLGKEEDACATDETQDGERARPDTCRRPPVPVVPGLPRPGTFQRQESERRERLMPHQPGPTERRALSVDRRRAVSAGRPTHSRPPALPSVSAPEVNAAAEEGELDGMGNGDGPTIEIEGTARDDAEEEECPPAFDNLDEYSDAGALSEGVNDEVLQEELEKRWILNLSMHFRDRSDREKFFVTFAESSTQWRRLTVSCDYRNAPPDSLEQDLKALRYQRDKSARVYESIRESLPDIQFYNTVTNLKLQTTDGRLHVHVTEDVNEIIPYPSIAAVAHLDIPRYKESAVHFDSHLSGFVYRVNVENEVYIKKEIPGPDSVDEFLYEINALHSLVEARSVIRFGGVIVDDEERHVKGLLISFAEQGALIDVLYDEKGKLPWKRRERWARQIVQGLSEIHEAGFVQGDFTLSNIVVDEADDAKIIDINRRGCPVGWEPPEVSGLIGSGQRVSMYIGVKSDIFQLGMVLWALAMEQDEPEIYPRPLSFENVDSDVPQYFRDIVTNCLTVNPRLRESAKGLLASFPDHVDEAGSWPLTIVPEFRESFQGSSNPSEKQYIDPSAAVEREDLDRFRHLSTTSSQPRSHNERDERGENQASSEEATYVNAASSARGIEGEVYPRGKGTATYVFSRSARYSLQRIDSDVSQHAADPPGAVGKPGSTSATPTAGSTIPLLPHCTAQAPDDEEKNSAIELDPQIVSVSPSDDHRWEEILVEGHPYLIDRQTWGKTFLDDDEKDEQPSFPKQANPAGQVERERADAVPYSTAGKKVLEHFADPSMSVRHNTDLAGVGMGIDADLGKMSAEDEIRLGVGK